MPIATEDGRISAPVVKCVVIGDGAVGKTCLLISYAKGSFPEGYVPTVFDNYAVTLSVQDQKTTLHLLDTAGQEDYDKLRPLSYSNASVFLVCFSVASKTSFENIRDKWYPELKRYSPGIPFVLVGTQADRRQSSGDKKGFVSIAEGTKLAKELGAVSYVECSAKSRDGLRDVFVGAILAALDPNRSKSLNSKKKKSCTFM